MTFSVREASGTDVSGPASVPIVLNFEAARVAVGLPGGIEPTDLAEPSIRGPMVAVDVVGVFPLRGPLDGTPVVRRSSSDRSAGRKRRAGPYSRPSDPPIGAEGPSSGRPPAGVSVRSRTFHAGFP